MKRIFLAIAVASSFTAAYAQQPPIPAELVSEMPSFNNWVRYWDAGYSNQINNNATNGENSHNTSTSINPGLGYRVTDHLTLGVQGGFNYNTSKTTNTVTSISDQNKTDAWTAGIFVRHSYNEIAKYFFVYSQLNLSYYGIDAYPSGNAVVSATDQVVNGYGYQANCFMALGVHLPHNFGLTLNLGGISYTYLNQDHGGGNNANFNVNFCQTIKIGLQKEFNFHSSHERAYREPGEELHKRSMENMGNDDEESGGSKKERSRKVNDMDED